MRMRRRRTRRWIQMPTRKRKMLLRTQKIPRGRRRRRMMISPPVQRLRAQTRRSLIWTLRKGRRIAARFSTPRPSQRLPRHRHRRQRSGHASRRSDSSRGRMARRAQAAPPFLQGAARPPRLQSRRPRRSRQRHRSR
jgi:hypothetical protein